MGCNKTASAKIPKNSDKRRPQETRPRVHDKQVPVTGRRSLERTITTEMDRIGPTDTHIQFQIIIKIIIKKKEKS